MFKNPSLNNSQPTASTMVVLPQEEWLNLHEKLDRLAELVTNCNADDRNSEWIESDAARKMLGISPKTWQNYRDQRVIPFSQIGRKIYVCRADLEAFRRSSSYRELTESCTISVGQSNTYQSPSLRRMPHAFPTTRKATASWRSLPRSGCRKWALAWRTRNM